MGLDATRVDILDTALWNIIVKQDFSRRHSEHSLGYILLNFSVWIGIGEDIDSRTCG